GYSVSSGSSCTSSTLTPSHVLRAMGVLSEGNVRVSLPAGTTAQEVNGFLDLLPGVVAGVREKLGVAEPVAAAEPVAESLEVDALGLRCPQPVIELARVITSVPVGGTVTVLSDDEVARLDIPAWCALRGHAYLGESPRGQGVAYAVRRLR
ncbi:sulfurtransferase TusA family protein, partial [Streptomyces goshikiensis]